MNNQIIESFLLRSNEIINLLFKLQRMIGSSISLINSSNDDKELSNLLCEFNTFLLNDDLITLVKDQQYELIASNEQYVTATEEIARLEEERESLSEKIHTLTLNQNDPEENNTKVNTVSLSDYNNLKEEYLQLYSKNQSYEQKIDKYETTIKSYQKSKENFYFMTYSDEALKQEYELKYQELNERLSSLMEENTALKNQFQEKQNQSLLFENEKNEANNKINNLNRKHRLSLSKIKAMEITNNALKNNTTFLKSKLIKTKEENEKKIEKIKHIKNSLLNNQTTMSKDICKEFFQNFENKNVSFHYIPSDNIIAIYFTEEKIGEVRNKSMSSIKRNQSNKLVLNYKYLLTDYAEVDKILTQKKETEMSIDENTLKYLNSMDESSSNENNNHLNLLSWDFDNKLTFANRDFCKIEKMNTNTHYINGISSITTDFIQKKTEVDDDYEIEDESDISVNVSDEDYIEIDKTETKKPIEEKKEDIPKNSIDINNMSPQLSSSHRSRKQKHHDMFYSKNYYDVNNNHIAEENINQVISQDNIKENKCFYCFIF